MGAGWCERARDFQVFMSFSHISRHSHHQFANVVCARSFLPLSRHSFVRVFADAHDATGGKSNKIRYLSAAGAATVRCHLLCLSQWEVRAVLLLFCLILRPQPRWRMAFAQIFCDLNAFFISKLRNFSFFFVFCWLVVSRWAHVCVWVCRPHRHCDCQKLTVIYQRYVIWVCVAR